MERPIPSLARSLALTIAAVLCAVAAYLAADDVERVLLRNTAALVYEVERCALPVAAVLAFLIARTNLAGKTLALVLCSSLLFVPLYLQLCGWDAAFGRQGWHTFAFNTLAEPWLSFWRGAVFVHVMYAIPWATCLMSAAFSQGNRQHEEAALLDGARWQVFSQVTLPQLAGGVLIAAAWVLVITAGEMTVTNIYLVPTYTEDVYNFYAGNADVLATAVHFLPLFLFVAALVLVFLAILHPTASLEEALPYVWPLGRGRIAISVCVLLILLTLVAFPLGNLVQRMGEGVVDVQGQPFRAWTIAKWFRILTDVPGKFSQEFANTLVIAAWTTLLALLLSAWLAWNARRRAWASAVGWTITALGIALPGPIIGLAVIALLNHDVPPLPYVYDKTLIPPVLAILVRVLPLTFVALWWGLRTLDREPLEAAALEGAGTLRTIASIALPQRWPIVAVAALAAFVVATGDVSASLLVLPPGPNETIARRMFGMIHIGADDQVGAVAFVCWLGYLLTAVLAVMLFRRVCQARAVEHPF